MTRPNTINTNYSYDGLSHLLSPVSTTAFGFTYDALSRRTQMTRPNGLNTNYNYDGLSRLQSVLHQVGTATPVDGATYTYDNAGNRRTRHDNRTNADTTYDYDSLYQLTSANGSSESYSYDQVGNRRSSTGISNYVVNNSNQLTSTSNGTSYTYDNNGNTATKVDGSGTTTYNWDFENRLASVALPASGGTVTFKYDPFGRRIQKVSSLNTTNYLYDGENLLQEVNSSGNVLARYTQTSDIDAPLSEQRGANTGYYQSDEAVGSITSLSDDAGALVNTYSYDTFGSLTASTGTLINSFRYTGREFDSETGLYFYRARYFDSSTGRFLSEDPIRFQGGVDFYTYVDNSPINEYDPFGWAGGPKKPKGRFRCKFRDSCKLLQWKIALFEKSIYSHIGWDSFMPWPRGGGRHNDEIAELFNGLARCIEFYLRKCKDQECKKKREGGTPGPDDGTAPAPHAIPMVTPAPGSVPAGIPDGAQFPRFWSPGYGYGIGGAEGGPEDFEPTDFAWE